MFRFTSVQPAFFLGIGQDPLGNGGLIIYCQRKVGKTRVSEARHREREILVSVAALRKE